MQYPTIYDRNDSPVALIAEDDDGIRNRIAAYLRRKGYGVLEAKTSVEALLLAVEYSQRIDALFASLDLRKYCNGAELAGCLRSTRPDMMIFYLSASGNCSEEINQELVQGQATLLRKPVSTPRMAEAVGLMEANHAWLEAELAKVNP